MFLYEGDQLKSVTIIKGVRYITVSHYGGNKEVQDKLTELIEHDFCSSELNNLTNESSLDLGMAITRQNGYCVSQTNEKEDI